MDTFNCQPLLDRLTLVMVKSAALREFSKRQTALDKIKYLMQAQILYEPNYRINIREEIENLLSVLYDGCIEHRKCEASAIQAKTNGSKAYMKKNDTDALNKYNECIILAPTNSPTLPLAYANRSAVLVQMKKYKEALGDMERAEKLGYPQNLLHKLLIRRGKCYAALGKIDEAREALERLRKLDLTEECREKSEKEALEIESSLENCKEEKICVKEELVVPELIYGENKLVKYMTSAFDMRQNDKYGRHIVANNTVERGNVVFTESPYAVLLVPDLLTKNCNNCLKATTLPIPCDGCRDIVYCSIECQNVGKDGCHQYECSLLHLLSSVGIAHLALRILLVAGWNTYSKIRDEAVGEVSGVGNDGVYNNSDDLSKYRCVYHLMPHLDSCSPEDQLQYCLASIILAKTISDKTDFLKRGRGIGWNVESLACAVMRHIAQLVSNAHAITKVDAVDGAIGDGAEGLGGVSDVAQRRIASAIYPTASIMNHSCKPNIINSFVGDTLVIRSIENIKDGDQIYNCYGPHYCRQTRDERQSALKQQYFFTCKCGPCTQPEYMRKEALWNGVQCESCCGVATWVGNDNDDNSNEENTNNIQKNVLLCIQCHKLQSPSLFLYNTVTDIADLLKQGEDSMAQGDFDEAISCFKGGLGPASAVLHKNNATLVTLRDKYAAALANIGDYAGCCEELGICTELTESRYGPNSVELAHELLKYSDALTMASRVNGNSAKNTTKYIDELASVKKKIDDIFSMNYGPQWKLYLGLE